MFEEYRRRAEMMGGNIRESLKKQSAEISESLFSNSTSVSSYGLLIKNVENHALQISMPRNSNAGFKTAGSFGY